MFGEALWLGARSELSIRISIKVSVAKPYFSFAPIYSILKSHPLFLLVNSSGISQLGETQILALASIMMLAVKRRSLRLWKENLVQSS